MLCFLSCVRFSFIVHMYYVIVIAFSHHAFVVMCFIHIIIIIILGTGFYRSNDPNNSATACTEGSLVLRTGLQSRQVHLTVLTIV